jgi:acetyl esterase/lipase
MKLVYLLSIIYSIFLSYNSYAQTKIIPLWENTIPGEIKISEYKETITYKDALIQSISNVNTPSLACYFPKTTNGTAILILPGGGYDHLSMFKEGHKVAEWLTTFGLTAFVLKYRLPNDKIMTDKSIGPLQDAQEAMRLIRVNASNWNLKDDRIGILGFSAGGHLTSTLSTHFNLKTYTSNKTVSARPDFSILVYPVISMKNEITHKGSQKSLLGSNPSKKSIDQFSNELWVTSETPLTFIVHATDDKSVSVENSIRYYQALKKNNVSVEMHLYEKGDHGFGLGIKDTSSFWPSQCIEWLKSHNYL